MFEWNVVKANKNEKILTVNNLFIAILSWKISSQYGTNPSLSKAPSSLCFWTKQEKLSFKLWSDNILLEELLCSENQNDLGVITSV